MDFILSFLRTGVLDFSVWQLVAATLLLTHITIASVTIFLHRAQAHRALDLHPLPAHFFRFWLWLTTGMKTKEWVAIHRKHHAKCEREGDPHSPKIFGLKTLLLQGSELYRAEAKNQETLEKYSHGVPDDWLERNVYSRFPFTGVAIMLVIDWLLFGAIGTTVWAVQMLWIPITAAGIINGIGHAIGYRNWESPDASTNIVPWGIIIGGEELHNNHHAFGSSAKLSARWYEFDIGWLYIRLLEMARLAKVRKVAPMPKFAPAKSVCDLETLQAVITHRYDVMAKYAKSINAAWREEVARLKAARSAEWTVVKRVKGWLAEDHSGLPDAQRATLAEAFAASRVLKTVVEMRAELNVIWERSTASREQLLAQLQDWCARAEASGIRALQEFSLRLRSYAA